MTVELSKARRIAFTAAGLGQDFAPRADGAAMAVAHLSSVQIDTISVVERAHHHILWSRVPRYLPRHLGALEAGPRRVIEYWSHAAAYLPLEEYRFCIPRMERIRLRGHDWFRTDPKTVSRVRDRIRAEGPLCVRDFNAATGDADPRGERAGWWDWKPAKLALEYLFHAGELVSTGREGFQKRYDLAERVLPSGLDLRRPTKTGMAAWYLDMATRTLGIFSLADVAYGRRDLVEGVPRELAQRVEAGHLVELNLEGETGGRPHYAAPATLDALDPAGGKTAGRVFILSPFDPLVIDRRRLSRLFGPEFTIECYVPAAKRRFGYFALPLLFRDRLGEISWTGLLDAKAERGARLLRLKRLSVEGLAPSRRASFVAAFGAEVERYARFNACDAIVADRIEADDPKLLAALRARLG